MQYKNLTIVGTSHIAKQSYLEVKHAINTIKPDIVAVELDNRRKYALLNNQKTKPRLSDIATIGIKGFLFSVIAGFIQKKLGQKVGIMPGTDMLIAIKLAQENKIPVKLIDQDILITLRKLKQVSVMEYLKILIFDPVKTLIFRKQAQQLLDIKSFDLNKVPDKKLIKKILTIMKNRYPTLYNVLIKERNEVMAKRLKMLMSIDENKKVLAVVGAGHAEDMLDLVKTKKIDVVNYNYSYSYE
jgi:pheromone shutdown protein TraB